MALTGPQLTFFGRAKLKDEYNLDVKLVQLDVTDAASIQAAKDTIEKAEGRLDTLVNNAGTTYAYFHIYQYSLVTERYELYVRAPGSLHRLTRHASEDFRTQLFRARSDYPGIRSSPSGSAERIRLYSECLDGIGIEHAPSRSWSETAPRCIQPEQGGDEFVLNYTGKGSRGGRH